ncbi:MAG: DUF3310 domain-containing protein [Patescibacteria group bacterium]|nr:DUF3310 domain-containing protein [Patescibacteria group bacterium]
MKDLQKHIEGTYKEHYTFNNGKQALDLFFEISKDLARNYCLANALKYLLRYGKKGGKNRTDLLKAAHCIALLAHFDGLDETDAKL